MLPEQDPGRDPEQGICGEFEYDQKERAAKDGELWYSQAFQQHPVNDRGCSLI